MGRLLTSRNHGGMSSRNAGPRHRMFGPTAGESKLDSMLDSERKNLDLDGGDRNLYGATRKNTMRSQPAEQTPSVIDGGA